MLMAGSWSHITTDKGKFRGTQLLDNLGDAYEALEECYGMVWKLAGIVATATGKDPADVIADAEEHYKDGLAKSPGRTGKAKEQGGRFGSEDWGEV